MSYNLIKTGAGVNCNDQIKALGEEKTSALPTRFLWLLPDQSHHEFTSSQHPVPRKHEQPVL